MNAQLTMTHPSADLIQKWWHNCSTTACTLPKEHTDEWISLISEVVRNYRLLLHSAQITETIYYRSRCQQSLAKARWELMLLSVYGLIPKTHLQELEELQQSLEASLHQ